MRSEGKGRQGGFPAIGKKSFPDRSRWGNISKRGKKKNSSKMGHRKLAEYPNNELAPGGNVQNLPQGEGPKFRRKVPILPRRVVLGEKEPAWGMPKPSSKAMESSNKVICRGVKGGGRGQVPPGEGLSEEGSLVLRNAA